MRRKGLKVYEWLYKYRMHLCIALLVVAGMLLLQRAEMQVIPESELSARNVAVKYIGSLETVVSRNGINHGSTRLNGGFGIGVDNDIDRDEYLRKLRPVIYLPFAQVLGVGREQIAALEGNGQQLRIGLYQGEIVTVHSLTGPVLTYQAYAEKMEACRNIWLVVALLTAISSILLFLATLVRHPSLD